MERIVEEDCSFLKILEIPKKALLSIYLSTFQLYAVFIHPKQMIQNNTNRKLFYQCW